MIAELLGLVVFEMRKIISARLGGLGWSEVVVEKVDGVFIDDKRDSTGRRHTQ